jgi:hypothetical protein
MNKKIQKWNDPLTLLLYPLWFCAVVLIEWAGYTEIFMLWYTMCAIGWHFTTFKRYGDEEETK